MNLHKGCTITKNACKTVVKHPPNNMITTAKHSSELKKRWQSIHLNQDGGKTSTQRPQPEWRSIYPDQAPSTPWRQSIYLNQEAGGKAPTQAERPSGKASAKTSLN
jgi:hypothetical protein